MAGRGNAVDVAKDGVEEFSISAWTGPEFSFSVVAGIRGDREK
jgi:hypothetical protein